MNWFLIALAAPLLWAIVNHADKYLLSKHSTHSSVGSLMIFSSFAGVIVAVIAPFFSTSLLNISYIHALLLILAGVIAAVAITLYLHALNQDETSVVVPLMQLIPVFGLIFGYIFLGETLSILQIIGFFIVISGSILITLEFIEEGRWKLKTTTLLLMVINCLLFASYETIFKFIAVDVGFVTSTFWEHVGLLLYGITLFSCFPKFRNEFLAIINHTQHRVRILGLNIGSEVLTLTGNVCTNYALLLAPIGLVLLVGSFQPVFVFIIGIVLTLFFPHISEEKVTFKHLLHKIVSILIILVGSYLIFYN